MTRLRQLEKMESDAGASNAGVALLFFMAFRQNACICFLINVTLFQKNIRRLLKNVVKYNILIENVE